VRTDTPGSIESPHRSAGVVALVAFFVLMSIALTVDVPRSEPGIQGDIKGDEATYVAAALSLAYDRDLRFERGDLVRFEGLYHRGPEGIFLKRGQTGRTDRVYFAKSLAYAVFVAPLVWLFGMNGFLVFHVLLLSAAAVSGYLFLASQVVPLTAALFTAAFFFASALPVYGVFLAPEIFNFALSFVAYFLWLQKEVHPRSRLIAPWTDFAAAALLGIVTYSKPTNWPLIVPLVLYAWWQRRIVHGFLVGTVFTAFVALGFGFTIAVTGEWNYQGGDRKTFYGAFPFDRGPLEWEKGFGVTTTGSAAQEMLTASELPARFFTNVKYFLIGRHFGLIPYFFPGVVALMAWLLSKTRRVPWRVLTFAGFLIGAVELLLLMPYTWSGGGGPTGNRYFLSIYPVMFYLMPPVRVVWPTVMAWAGGAMFTAKLLADPFTIAKHPYLLTEKGFARRLPVELTMANDLPVMLAQPLRGRIPYGENPTLLLYFLDQNAFPPEPPGMWVAGGRRANILVRSVAPIQHLVVTAESPIPTTLTLSMGRGAKVVSLAPGNAVSVDVPAAGTYGLRSYAYLLSITSSDGFIPHLQNPESRDYRNLGALLNLKAVTTVPN
jgi:hypothetical protein